MDYISVCWTFKVFLKKKRYVIPENGDIERNRKEPIWLYSYGITIYDNSNWKTAYFLYDDKDSVQYRGRNTTFKTLYNSLRKSK